MATAKVAMEQNIRNGTMEWHDGNSSMAMAQQQQNAGNQA